MTNFLAPDTFWEEIQKYGERDIQWMISNRRDGWKERSIHPTTLTRNSMQVQDCVLVKDWRCWKLNWVCV